MLVTRLVSPKNKAGSVEVESREYSVADYYHLCFQHHR